MEKKLQDYLHLYLGCEMVRPHGKKEGWVLRGVLVGNTNWQVLEGNDEVIRVATAKPILRPLSSMTEDEMLEYGKCVESLEDCDKAEFSKGGAIMFSRDGFCQGHMYPNDYNTAESFRYLLSKHFDLFGLHEAGLCIYENEIKL